jgi:MerR family copper efflux transcriptional regulator
VPEEPIIACSLTGGEQADRTEQWRRLLTTAIRSEPVSGGIRFVLPVEMSAQIAALAVAEQRCCPFFEFTLRLADGRLAFDVRAPTEAAALVADLFGT